MPLNWVAYAAKGGFGLGPFMLETRAFEVRGIFPMSRTDYAFRNMGEEWYVVTEPTGVLLDFLPLYLSFTPYSRFGPNSVPLRTYFYGGLNEWLALATGTSVAAPGAHCPDQGFTMYTQMDRWSTGMQGAGFVDVGVGLNWFMLCARAGYQAQRISGQAVSRDTAYSGGGTLREGSYEFKTSPLLGSTFYLSVGLDLGWHRPLGASEILPAALSAGVSFADADGNGILSGGESGKLSVTVQNKGEGKALGVLAEIAVRDSEYRSKLVFDGERAIGNIEGSSERTVTVPFKSRGELPKGEFTIDVTCRYKCETGERRIETGKVTVNTAPASGTVKVAFANLPANGMPAWIVPTPLEYADFQVQCTGGTLDLNTGRTEGREVTVLNLNTGERKSQEVASDHDAQQFVRNYFLSWDKENPTITLSSSGGTVSARTLKLPVRLSDDHKLGEMYVYLNGTSFLHESFAEQTETERNLEFPLNMGDNHIRILLADWVGKQDEKTATFTRIRGDSGTWYAGNLPQGEPPPNLRAVAEPIDGNNTIVGGKDEGIRVTVTNSGKGSARLVRVQLSGDSTLTGLWRRERSLEDIKPDQTQTAEFSVLMPSELERRTATVQVSVKEGRGYSPTEKPSLTFNLVPAETTTTNVEMVQDVNNDIPMGSAHRDGYALIVGISNYETGALKYARRDAETFREYASRTLGIGSVETLFDAQATSSRFRSRLENWLKTKQGFKVVYFAGHGTNNPENLSDHSPYLVPFDYDGTPTTLLSTKEIPDLCSTPSDTLLLVYDACVSGGTDRPIVAVHVPTTSAITLAAADSSQPSKEFDKAQHGYFTYYALLGLKGAADKSPYGNDDGWVTTTELYRYVKDKVSDATNEVQVPVLRPEREIRLGKYR